MHTALGSSGEVFHSWVVGLFTSPRFSSVGSCFLSLVFRPIIRTHRNSSNRTRALVQSIATHSSCMHGLGLLGASSSITMHHTQSGALQRQSLVNLSSEHVDIAHEDMPRSRPVQIRYVLRAPSRTSALLQLVWSPNASVLPSAPRATYTVETWISEKVSLATNATSSSALRSLSRARPALRRRIAQSALS